jgi:signal transduction histidine kinase
MPNGQPEDPIPHLLREIRERMATKDDIARIDMSVADLRSDLHSLGANVASDIHELDAKIDATRKDLSEQIVGLRRAIIDYHSSVIGHGNIIADLEARFRRVEQSLGLEITNSNELPYASSRECQHTKYRAA